MADANAGPEGSALRAPLLESRSEMVDAARQQKVRSQKELDAVLAAHERYASGRGGTRAQLAHTSLDGFNLANRKLVEAEFSGASLTKASFCRSDLERASFYCADLRDTNFRFANLVRTDMRGCSLKGASLAYAVLDGADLRSAQILMYSGDEDGDVSVLDRNRGKTADSKSSGPHGVDFSNCSLKNATFSKALLDGTNFSGALLQGARFKGAKLTNVSFKGAVLMGVQLKELNLPADALEGAVLDISPEAIARTDALKTALAWHQEWVLSGGKAGVQAILAGEDLRTLEGCLSNRVLATLDVSGSNAIGADFSNSHLQAARFDGADLRGANFDGADLRGSSFRSAKLTHARFDGANLRGLIMDNGSVVKADFTDADATLGQFMAATLNDPLAKLGLKAAE